MSTPHIVKVKPNGMRVHTFGYSSSDLRQRLLESGVKPPYPANKFDHALENCFTISITKAVNEIAFDKAFWNGDLTRGW